MAVKPGQKRRIKKDNLPRKQQELERLALEIKERKWNVSWLDKLAKLAPLFTPIVLAFSIILSAYWYKTQWNLQIEQQRLETKRQHKENVINLLKEFNSDNPAIRIAAARFVADNPESIPILISCLTTVKRTEEDKVFIRAVIDSLCRVGQDAVWPLVDELRRLEDEIKGILSKDIKNIVLLDIVPIHFSLNTAIEESLENVRNELRKVGFPEEETESFVGDLCRARSSSFQLIEARKNIAGILAFLLQHHHIETLDLSMMDLSGIYFGRVNLSGAKLRRTDLSNTALDGANLSSANLKDAFLYRTDLAGANLSNAILMYANLSDAHLIAANLTYADLQFANLSDAYFFREGFGLLDKNYKEIEINLAGANLQNAKLYNVKGFRNIKDFSNVNLKGVEGLSKEDLEYAKSKGAIVD